MGRLQEAAPALDDNVREDLRKLLTHRATKRRFKRKKRPGSESQEDSSFQDATIGASAHENVLQEAAAAGTNPNASGAAIALSTTVLPTTSDIALPTNSASSDERALSSAASTDDIRIRPLWEIKKEDVALPSEIVDLFETWKADPTVFLRSASSPVPSSLAEHYQYALSVRASVAVNKILWRFITTIYYDIISERSLSERYSITKEAVAFVVAVICDSSPPHNREAVEKNIISWAKDGGKYRALADKMGGTCCYFFYPDISEWM